MSVPHDPTGAGMANPYRPAAMTAGSAVDASIDVSQFLSPGLVNHVPILGVLMIVQGAMVLLMGGAAGLYAVFMPQVFEQIREQAIARGGNAPPPPNVGLWVGLVGGLLCLALVAVALGTIFGGLQAFRFRRRSFSIVVLLAGLVTIVTCYCLPTQIGLTIYGLIVLLNPQVMHAFRLADQGHAPADVQRHFLSLRSAEFVSPSVQESSP
ncbi:MAG: hypothetical protein AAGA03_17995 [Planctomycetota bacterium]